MEKERKREKMERGLRTLYGESAKLGHVNT